MGLINEHDETKNMLNILREYENEQGENVSVDTNQQDTRPVTQQNNQQGGVREASEEDVSDQDQKLKKYISDGMVSNITIHNGPDGSGVGATVYGNVISLNIEWKLSLNEPSVSNGVTITKLDIAVDGNGNSVNTGVLLDESGLSNLRKLYGFGKNFVGEFSETLGKNYPPEKKDMNNQVGNE